MRDIFGKRQQGALSQTLSWVLKSSKSVVKISSCCMYMGSHMYQEYMWVVCIQGRGEEGQSLVEFYFSRICSSVDV